jgi:hypothetical protein
MSGSDDVTLYSHFMLHAAYVACFIWLGLLLCIVRLANLVTRAATRVSSADGCHAGGHCAGCGKSGKCTRLS